MIKINYINGMSYTYKDPKYFIDGWVDWDEPALGIHVEWFDENGKKVASTPAYHEKLAYKDVISIEDHSKDCVVLWKNPKYSLSIMVDTKTARQRMKENYLSSYMWEGILECAQRRTDEEIEQAYPTEYKFFAE